MEYFDPVYKWEIKLGNCEKEIVNTKLFKKLHHIFHVGLHAFISPLRHTRFEHSLGVFSLTKYFGFKREIRIAALLHDVGHIAFSHSAEKVFGEGLHHKLTKKIILEGKIAKILKKYNFNPKEIFELTKKWPLESEEEIMNLDHLDSFFRDTYFMGIHKTNPKNLIRFIKVKEGKIVTYNKNVAKEIMNLCLKDNERLTSDGAISCNCLGIKIFKLAKDLRVIDTKFLLKATEYEVIAKMLLSKNRRLQTLVKDLLFNLGNYKAIKVKKGDFKLKLYLETIFLNKDPYWNIDRRFQRSIEKLRQKIGYYVAKKN
jgi:hypothetical protein